MSFQFPKKEESPLQNTWEMDNRSHGAKNNPGRHCSRPEGNTSALGRQMPICLGSIIGGWPRQSLNMVICIPLSQHLDDVISFPSLCFHTAHHFLGLLCCLHLSSLYTSHHSHICLNLLIFFSAITWNSLPGSKLSFVFKIFSTHVIPLTAKVKIYLQTSLLSDFE